MSTLSTQQNEGITEVTKPSLELRWQELKDSLVLNSKSMNNSIRRVQYTKLELFRIEIERLVLHRVIESAEVSELYAEISQCGQRLKLEPHAKFTDLPAKIDYLVRLIAFIVGFIPAGTIAAIVLVLLKAVDDRRERTPSYFSYEIYFRQCLAKCFLQVLGINMIVEGLTEVTFESNCSILTFSHSSNLDGFFICASCPVRHAALAKKELFIIPFFSWITLALGGVPVDRSNRDSAVRTLQRLSEQDIRHKTSFVIAPEGTRSTTGQLLQFKKGTFHLWEDLRAPIIPVVFLGSYDLWPVGRWINNTGTVVVRYLKPIMPDEVLSRDEMLLLVRQRMLESIGEVSDTVAAPLSDSSRKSWLFVRIVWLATILFSIVKFNHLLLVTCGMSISAIVGWYAAISTFVTIFLYVIFVYGMNHKQPRESRTEESLKPKAE